MTGTTTYTEEKGLEICERIANGESLVKICKDESMPAISTVFKWLTEQKAFSDNYVRARDVQADVIADEVLTIADDATNDWMERHDPENPGWEANGEHLQRSRLRIDTRKWLAGKMKPKKYGEKIDTTTTLQNPDGSALKVTLIELVAPTIVKKDAE